VTRISSRCQTVVGAALRRVTYAKVDRLTPDLHTSAEASRVPFWHILMAPVLEAGVAADLLDQLCGLTWQRNLGSRFCFSIPEPSPDYIASHKSIISSPKFDAMIYAIVAVYQFRTVELIGLDLHKYDQGTGIGAHTDRGLNEFRFVLNLNRNWEPSHGGIWILSNTSDLSGQTRYVAPIHNTGFGFRPGLNTFHALSERYAGTSYALVFRFSNDDVKVL
jgi:hypothetical protein